MPDIKVEDLKEQLKMDHPWRARLRSTVPAPLAPVLASVRAGRGKKKQSMRDMARTELTFLLGEGVAPERLELLIDGYIEQWFIRAELRWRYKALADVEVKGMDGLKAARDAGNGVVLNFMHHGNFEGAIARLALDGVPQTVLLSDAYFNEKISDTRRQLLVLTIRDNIPHTVAQGRDAITNLLHEGRVIALATDVPGRAPMTFLGQERVCSSGAARTAAAAGSPVVVITSRQDAKGKAYIQLSDPMHPADYESPEALLEAMVRYHEDAVRAWPEAYDSPTTRWGVPAVVEEP